MYNFIDFSGKKFIVAGASSGIGKQTAITISKLGGEVILLARREDRLKEVLYELDNQRGAYYCIDLSKTEEIESLFKDIVEEHGKIDGLVYSAGITIDVPLHLMKKEKTERVFDVNFYGFVECVKQVCKKGRFNEGLRIVGVSSIASLIGTRAHESYAASKAAMNAFIKCVAVEQAEKGISINNVAPGWVNTEMVEKHLSKTGKDIPMGLSRQYKGMIMPDDIANVIAYLLSDAARMITGQVIPVDGGLSSC